MTESEHRDYRSLGELLRDAREAKGLDIPGLSQRTRISVGMIEAIESDDYETLASPVYARSFLRNLARELGQDPDWWLNKYDHATAGGSPAETPQPDSKVSPENPFRPADMPEPASAAAPDATLVQVEGVRVRRVKSGGGASLPAIPWARLGIGLGTLLLLVALIFLISRIPGWVRDSGEQVENLQTLSEESAVASIDSSEALDPLIQGEENPAEEIVLPTPGATPPLDAAAAEPETTTPEEVAQTESENELPSAIQPAARRSVFQDSLSFGGAVVRWDAGAPLVADEDLVAAARLKAVRAKAMADSIAAAEIEAAAEASPPPPAIAKATSKKPTQGAVESPVGDEVVRPESNTEGRLDSIVRRNSGSQMKLEIRALRRSDVWAASDGESRRKRTLQPGESWLMSAGDHFSLELEDPGAVEIQLDGRRIDPPPRLSGEWVIYPETGS